MARELSSCCTWTLGHGLQLFWPEGSVVVVNGLSCTRICGVFLYQELYPCLLHWQVDSSLLDQQGSPMAIHFLSFKNKISYLVTFSNFCSFIEKKIDCIHLVKVKADQLCLTLQPQGLYSPWNSPGQNAGVGSLSLLQGIFPTQGLNPGLLHCRWVFTS